MNHTLRSSTLGLKEQFWSALSRWWGAHARQYPWRHPNLSAYEVILSEILLKRMTATAASRVFPQLVEHYPNPGALMLADEAGLSS